MCVELEPMDELERELRQALERQPAPPSLKRKVIERRVSARTAPGAGSKGGVAERLAA